MDNTPEDDELDDVSLLRRLAASLPDQRKVRDDAINEGLSLGLPSAWLVKLPKHDVLPGDYTRSEYGRDASLTWKAQEHLARTGRLSECDPMLVAEALEGAARDDGGRPFRDYLTDILFILSWPVRTYSLHCQLRFACDMVMGAIEGSPSVLLYEDLARDWQQASYRAAMLDGSLRHQEECPWPSLADVLRAAADRLDEGSEMEARRCRGETLPQEYRFFLD
jgi:hypothetical protein